MRLILLGILILFASIGLALCINSSKISREEERGKDV